MSLLRSIFDLGTPDLWHPHLRRWQQEGLSEIEYCRAHDLRVGQLLYWHAILNAGEPLLDVGPARRKHLAVLLALNPLELYSPGRITMFASENGFWENDSYDARVRLRRVLVRFCQVHRFPEKGDGLVRPEGQPPVPGWHGKRWFRSAIG